VVPNAAADRAEEHERARCRRDGSRGV